MKLTKRAIDSLAYTRKSGAQCVWDDDLAGFGVRIYPTGRKSFVVAYHCSLGRFRAGRARLGSVCNYLWEPRLPGGQGRN